MDTRYFAHSGVEHATPAEATAHESSNNWFVIIAVTAVVFVTVFAVMKFLSMAAKEDN